jgi:hypothetical protein
MITRTRTLALAALGLVLGQAARAGLLDSPPPMFGAVQGQVVYRMGPVHFAPGHTDTVISCSNADGVSIGVAVELFDENDQRIGGIAQAEPAPGGGASFATSADAANPDWVVIPDLPALHHGKARVSATSRNLSCSARYRIRASDGSVREQALELVKKIAAPPAPR